MSFVTATIATLLLSAPALAPQFGPPSKAPLRNTFVVATESVLDQEASLDLNADAAAFDPAMATLKAKQQNLQDLAADEPEQAIVQQIASMIFTLTSCRIQAVDGADISRCLLKLADARTRTLQTIHKHKENGLWVDGDPRP